ncbi:hypothetical protein RHO13_08065 [Orbus wheelerorum]|uniref:hypothetical protein n=1 Tax=Orbus wheelerorum TaxID=3074111 RepID=UPI00370D8646
MWRENVVLELSALLNSDEHRRSYRYLLLDMLGVSSELSDIYPEALRDTLSSEEFSPIKRPELQHDLASCPHLICLAKPNHDVNHSLLFASQWQASDDFLVTKQYVCGWIVSEQPIEELAQSLLSIGQKLGALLSMRFFPFYEPFRIQLLQDSHLSYSNWIEDFLPQNTHYYYMDITQSIRQVNSVNRYHSPKYFLDYTIGFFQRESTSLFRLYVSWYDLNQKQGREVKLDALSIMMKYYLDANVIGLSNAEDRTLFVLFSMQYGNLTQNPILKDIIDDVALNAQGTLAKRLRQVESELSQLTNTNG